MDPDIEFMIRERVKTVEVKVIGQTSVKHGPAIILKKRPRPFPGLNMLILQNLRYIVKEKWDPQSIAISQSPGDRDDQKTKDDIGIFYKKRPEKIFKAGL